MRSTRLLLGCVPLMLINCVAEPEDTNSISENLLELTIEPGESLDLRAVLDIERSVVVTVDCGVPANPDMTSALVAVSGESFAVAGEMEGAVRADYWRWAGDLSEGEHTITVANKGDQQASCKIYMSGQDEGASCNSWSEHRSTIRTAVHLPVGTSNYGEWETLPASGNHWGAWAMWGRVYDKPVLRGFYLHNLEHGGLVLSYGCQSADESEACAKAEQQLIDLANTFGENRILITPDPDQPTMYAVRAWRFAHASDCLDEDVALSFMKNHFRHGREDIEGNVPIEFDPTVTDDVPCEDLMAAPDGC